MKLLSTWRGVPLTVALLFLASSAASGQTIYQWTDEQGNTHYSSEPEHPGAKPAQLPSINRVDIDESIKKLKAETPPSCDKHGGVDCSQNADTDGSVICLDGYRDAKLPFRFECMEARLKSELTLKIAGSDAFLKHSKRLREKLEEQTVSEFFLSTRNLSGIEAYGIKAEMRLPGKGPVPLTGPEKIDPFGQADYQLSQDVLRGLSTRDIEQARYRISCTNCSTSLGVN